MIPNLPANTTKRVRDTVAFLGVNYTDNYQDGEIFDAVNLSSQHFPCLESRDNRTQVSATDPTDIFEWDGKLIVVDDGGLYYDGTLVGSVTPGQKQFAVVNTKIIIFPDKVYYDLTNNTFGHLDVELSTGTTAGSVVITDDSISASLSQLLQQSQTIRFVNYYYARSVYTYGMDREDVEACWDGSAWDMTALESLQHYMDVYAHSRDIFVTERPLQAGDIIIPKITASTTYPYEIVPGSAYSGQQTPDTSQYNTQGIYGVISRNSYYDDDTGATYIYANIYQANSGNVLFSGTFKVGDAVDITGTRFGIADAKHAVITAISDSDNKLTFSANTIKAPTNYLVVESEIPASIAYEVKLSDGSICRRFTPTKNIDVGRILYMIGTEVGDSIYVWDSTTKRIEAEYVTEGGGNNNHLMTAYDPIDGASITIAKTIPDLDFICAKDNRLWGVSNSQENEVYNAQTGGFDVFTSRVIYASALGDPSNWWTFQGVDTDSWQVAVGSEGDFTALVAFDGICAFKENRLHKILGNYPSEYYMSEYQLDGVGAGNHRSVSVINEVLYYAGKSGINAYTGGQPVNIGLNLGGPVTGAVAGTDGRRWLLYGTFGGLRYGTYYSLAGLMVYDLVNRVWMREDNCGATAFANVSGTMYMLTSTTAYGNRLWRLNTGYTGKDTLTDSTTPDIGWCAEFKPFYEMTTDRYASTAIRRRYYLRVILRVEMKSGSTISVRYKCDDDATETTILNAETDTDAIKLVEIPARRADKMIVCVYGTGRVKLYNMSREWIEGSERA